MEDKTRIQLGINVASFLGDCRFWAERAGEEPEAFFEEKVMPLMKNSGLRTKYLFRRNGSGPAGLDKGPSG